MYESRVLRQKNFQLQYNKLAMQFFFKYELLLMFQLRYFTFKTYQDVHLSTKNRKTATCSPYSCMSAISSAQKQVIPRNGAMSSNVPESCPVSFNHLYYLPGPCRHSSWWDHALLSGPQRSNLGRAGPKSILVTSTHSA